MRTHHVAGVLAAAAAAGALVAGCGGNTTTSSTTTAPPAASNAPVTGQQQHNQADVVFLQNMIAHHNQAIMMSQMARTRATTPHVKDLAARIEAEQTPEIQQMRSLLTAWGVSPNPEGMGPMGGMGGMGGMGPDQGPGMMSGAAFDRMFLQMMIVHHQGAIDMSQTELAQGSNPDARQLAQKIINAQSGDQGDADSAPADLTPRWLCDSARPDSQSTDGKTACSAGPETQHLRDLLTRAAWPGPSTPTGHGAMAA